MSKCWSRRTLLAWAALAATGCTSSVRRAAVLPRPTVGSSRESVIVVGGGLAGLASAYRLLTCGRSVLLLEATQRAGGRICTVRQPWRDGLFVEAGASHLVADPALLALLDELGIGVESRPAARQLARVRIFSASVASFRRV